MPAAAKRFLSFGGLTSDLSSDRFDDLFQVKSEKKSWHCCQYVVSMHNYDYYIHFDLFHLGLLTAHIKNNLGNLAKNSREIQTTFRFLPARRTYSKRSIVSKRLNIS